MSQQVIIAREVGGQVVPVKCPRCGGDFLQAYEQYLACGCQTHLLEAKSQISAEVIVMPIHFRNLVLQLMTLGRAAQALQQYIPGAAGMVPG